MYKPRADTRALSLCLPCLAVARALGWTLLKDFSMARTVIEVGLDAYVLLEGS